MALVAADYIKPVRMLKGGAIPILSLRKGSATTFVIGTVVIASSGLIVAATDGPTTGTVIGISTCAAVNGETRVNVCPAVPDIVFEGRVATGDTGGTVTIDDTNLHVGYGLALDSDIWYVNVGDTTDIAVAIFDRLDPDGTAWAKVHFTFIDSFYNKT